MAGRPGGSGAARHADVVPLTQRVGVLAVFRVLLAGVLLALAPVTGHVVGTADAAVAAAWLAVTAVLSLTVLVPAKRLAIRCFGTALLVDSAFLQVLHARLGHGALTDVGVAAFLVVVCLLASFRTGLKIAVWQTVVLVFGSRALQAGLGDALLGRAAVPLGGAASATLEHQVVQDAAMLWVVVLVTAVAAATNERELRRRRYDAESLAGFASDLHGCGSPEQVAGRATAFAVEELGAARAVVLRRDRDGVHLLGAAGPVRLGPAPVPAQGTAGRGTPPGGGGAEPGTASSALVDLVVERDGATTLVLRLDPARDAWLASLLPDAFRLVALAWGDVQDGVVLVVDLGRSGRGRAEQRVLTAVEQASAAAALACGRAELMQSAQRLAMLDGLTGLANRRTLDLRLDDLCRDWHAGAAPVALVLLDIDHFKAVNDRYGHPVGDQVLQVVGSILAAAAGPDDLPARYGGEEFCLVMPGADTAAAARMAEHLRVALRDVRHPVQVSGSFGVAALPADARTAAALVHAADAALLVAKQTGRDRVVPAAPRVAARHAPGALAPRE